MRNEMRRKLIELLLGKSTDTAEDAEYVADHLLADGWIRPPCKIGDTVYRLKKRRGIWEILPREVVSITHRLDHLHRLVWEIFTTEQDRLGKTVFITKAEAEKALKERENNGC